MTDAEIAANCNAIGEKRHRRAQLLGRARDLEDIDLPMEFDRLTLSWQPVDAEQEEQEQERQQTEAEREILDALGELGKAKAATIAKIVGKDRSNTHRRLTQLWKDGKCKRDLIDNEPIYFLKAENLPLPPNQDSAENQTL